MDPLSIYNIIQTGGVVALLILFLVGFKQKWWVMGWQYKEVEKSNARWMELALRSTNLAQSLEKVRQERPLADNLP